MKVQKKLSDSDRDIIEDEPYYRYVKIFISLVLIIIVGVVGYYLDKTFAVSSNIVTKIAGVQKTSTDQSRGVRIAKIQDVQVGERAIGLNPELDDDDDRDLFTPHRDPHPIDWRMLTLEMIKPDGKRLDITLLRPLYWIFESKAEIGSTIFLDLPEMGAQGIAKVLNIEPCPLIKPGRGNIITGTFHHEAANTIDVHIEGLSKPIGTTDNHPFWSVTRNEFIEAGKLQQGEKLQLYNGQTAKVIKILPRPGPERVHNLEVMNEHVYRVSDQGILVHNTYVYSKPIPKSGLVIRTNTTHRGQSKIDYIFSNKNDADNWSSNMLGHTKERIYDEGGQWIGWKNSKGDSVYWNHNDWGRGIGTSTYPHLNYDINGIKGHLYLQDKIQNRGMIESFQNEFR
jgi:hypothetical protein